MKPLLLALLVLSAEAQTLRIMSFNVRYPAKSDGANIWENRRDLLVDTIRKHAPDIMGTQELFYEQGQYIVEAFAYAKANWSPWVGPMFVWNLRSFRRIEGLDCTGQPIGRRFLSSVATGTRSGIATPRCLCVCGARPRRSQAALRTLRLRKHPRVHS